MKLKSNQPKATAEQVVKDIRRATRRITRLRTRYVLFSVALLALAQRVSRCGQKANRQSSNVGARSYLERFKDRSKQKTTTPM